MVAPCPADNVNEVEQSDFWTGGWDAHKIGWLISGAAAGLACLITLTNITLHSLHYTRPLQQRQIIRILLFPAVFALVSFLSYRFFRAYTYYELAEVAYEAFAIAAFLMLLLQYVGDNVDAQREVFARKEKVKLPLPFCCWRYRPSKPYFLHLLKWGVVQYIVVRPALSVVGIVLETQNLLCTSSYSYRYGEVYLVAIDFFSISVALYALIVLYGLLRDDLQGKKPLAKFMTIKLAIFFTFYQSFVFGVLQDHNVIKGTQYWTATNVSDGLSALCVCIEMVIVAAFQMWAFPWSEYYLENQPKPTPIGRMSAKGRTNIFRSLVHALNFSDFFVELWHSLRFGFDRLRGKEYTRSDVAKGKFDIAAAFGTVGQAYAAPAAGIQPGRPNGAKSDPATTSLRSGSPFEMQDRDADPLRHYPAGMGSGGSAEPAAIRQPYQQQWAGFSAAAMTDYNEEEMRPPPSMASRQRIRRPSYDPVPVDAFARPRNQTQQAPVELSVVHEPFPGIAPPPRNASGSTQALPIPDDPYRRVASPNLVVNVPMPGADGRLTPTSPMRRSPSPGGGPRESVGRYPSFIFDMSSKSGGTSQADSSAHSSLRPGQAYSSNNPLPGQHDSLPPRQPSPFDQRSWNNPYRVQGFPRESFIETQTFTPQSSSPPLNLPHTGHHDHSRGLGSPAPPEQTQYSAPQASPSVVYQQGPLPQQQRQVQQQVPQQVAYHHQMPSGRPQRQAEPTLAMPPPPPVTEPLRLRRADQQQAPPAQPDFQFDFGPAAASSQPAAAASPIQRSVDAPVAHWAARDSLFAPPFTEGAQGGVEDDVRSLRSSSRPGSWEPQAL